MPSSSARISPTAHYTCQVWVRHGLSDPAFTTRQGERLHRLLAPFNAGSRALGGWTLDGMLVARHRTIDHLLEAAIGAGEVEQVIEVAAGLSPRGWRMTRQYPELRYIEADLAFMAAGKRELLARAAPAGAGHEVAEIDALADNGPASVGAIAGRLDPTRGTAIVSEGLLNYFPREAAVNMWRRFSAALHRFPAGLYLADLSLRAEAGGLPTILFRAALSTFVRGGIYLDFHDEAHARRELGLAGFPSAVLHRPIEFAHHIGRVEPAGAGRVRIIEARACEGRNPNGA